MNTQVRILHSSNKLTLVVMYLSILFLPFISAVIVGLFGHQLGFRGSRALAVTCMSICALLCASLLVDFLCTDQFSTTSLNSIHFVLAPQFETGDLTVNQGFLFDPLTVTMLFVVSSISTMVHVYSVEYMDGDPHQTRFMCYISLFTFGMFILVSGDNFVQMFLGQELIGLCSFLLISFQHTRIQANKAAIKAMLVNRVGDFGLVLGLISIFYFTGSLDYSVVFACVPQLSESVVCSEGFFAQLQISPLSLISFFLFVGVAGKSAQLTLHTQLPDAMEAPTPISALLHAATLVTSGVFLLARCSAIFEYTPVILQFIVFMGASTAFFAATVGLVQNDIKKVIAYSTCSQLGYMVFACGLSAYAVGMFHLANHAFFKALLFLASGCVIHAMNDEQDMRRFGGLTKLLPLTYASFFIGSLSLMGFPFMTGFYSKDFILEVAYGSYSSIGQFSFLLGSVGAVFTAFYSFRLLHLTFFDNSRANRLVIANAHEPGFFMSFPLVFLTFGAVFLGYVLKDAFIGIGTSFQEASIFVHPVNEYVTLAEFAAPTQAKLLPTIGSLSGAFSAHALYHHLDNRFALYKYKTLEFRSLFIFLNRKQFFDKVYNELIVQKVAFFGQEVSYKSLDRGLIEILGSSWYQSCIL